MQTPTGIDVLNKWRFFGVQFYQVNSFLYVFKDTDTYVTNSISLSSLSPLNTLGTNYAIGRCNQNNSTCFQGYINDLKVYRGVTTLLTLGNFNQMRRYNIFLYTSLPQYVMGVTIEDYDIDAENINATAEPSVMTKQETNI